MKELKVQAKGALTRIRLKRFHLIHRKQARNALRIIERQKGKTNRKNITLADAYAREVLGSKIYAPWLYVYAAYRGDFREGWIPDNYYGEVVVPKIQGDYGKLSFNNLLSNSFFNTARFPDMAYYVNGQWFSKDLQPIQAAELLQIVFSNGAILFKTDHSFQGKGVHLFEKKDFNLETIQRLGNGVFQKFIRQHPFFDDFGIGATATIRITTIVNANCEVYCRAAYLRMGRKGETHVLSHTQVKVAIDITSGKLLEEGHLSSWESLKCHPDTQIEFHGKTIPHFENAVALCQELHSRAIYIGAIGWDVAIDAFGEVYLLEWNGFHNDIKYSEATQGPCFADLGWEHLWKTE